MSLKILICRKSTVATRRRTYQRCRCLSVENKSRLPDLTGGAL